MLFSRIPLAGRVKTRLIPALGAERACRLHSAMTRHCLEQMVLAATSDVQLWLDGETAAASPFATPGVSEHRQCEGDLGQRMAQAFRDNFARGYSRVLISGSDCPGLGPEHYHRLLAGLEKHDAVLIPALDGGYVALGLRRYDSSLFTDMEWGGATVCEITLGRIAALGWSWHALEPLPDIDRPEDLVHLERFELDY